MQTDSNRGIALSGFNTTLPALFSLAALCVWRVDPAPNDPGLLAATPAKAEGEAVPLRYVVPPNIAIELWDSGMPVFAWPGDTLLTLAAVHHVPLWSLTQINQMSERTPLVPGQRVVVPRHLVPLATVSRRSPTRR